MPDGEGNCLKNHEMQLLLFTAMAQKTVPVTGQVALCPLVGKPVSGAGLDLCRQITSNRGGNTFNVDPDRQQCVPRKCTGTVTYGGSNLSRFQVYSIL